MAHLIIEAFVLNLSFKEYATRAGLSIVLGILFFSDSALANINIIALYGKHENMSHSI